jgi:2-phosphoglycerate kinase
MEVIAYITTLRDIFFIRMQVVNNFFKFKRLYKKNRFSFLNCRLLKHLKYFKQIQINKKFVLLKNKILNINLIQKTLYNLSFVKFNLNSILVYKFIEIFFINKKISYIYYNSL